MITVLSKKGDWWKGELNEAVGLFPSNYVQPLNENLTAVEATRCKLPPATLIVNSRVCHFIGVWGKCSRTPSVNVDGYANGG